jgi:hypothetical protein
MTFKRISPSQLNSILKPKGYEYVPVKVLKAGQKIRWFDQDAKITEISEREDGKYSLMVIDPLDDGAKKFVYMADDKLLLSPSQ